MYSCSFEILTTSFTSQSTEGNRCRDERKEIYGFSNGIFLAMDNVRNRSKAKREIETSFAFRFTSYLQFLVVFTFVLSKIGFVFVDDFVIQRYFRYNNMAILG